MSEPRRVILELDDGTRLPPLDGIPALMVLGIWTNRDQIQRTDTGFAEFAFQGKKLHPLRLTASLPILPQPTRPPQGDPHAG